MTDIVERLRATLIPELYVEAADEIEWLRRARVADLEEMERLRAINEKLQAEIEEWYSCARYDPTMNGPAFKGWDRSQMERCRKRYIENASEQTTPREEYQRQLEITRKARER